jgi:hypothetical protein
VLTIGELKDSRRCSDARRSGCSCRPRPRDCSSCSLSKASPSRPRASAPPESGRSRRSCACRPKRAPGRDGDRAVETPGGAALSASPACPVLPLLKPGRAVEFARDFCCGAGGVCSGDRSQLTDPLPATVARPRDKRSLAVVLRDARGSAQLRQRAAAEVALPLAEFAVATITSAPRSHADSISRRDVSVANPRRCHDVTTE